MKVLVVGATGAIGRPLIRRLVEGGHEVVGTTRSAAKRSLVWDLGAKPELLDVLDAQAVSELVGAQRPDAIVHQATALQGVDFMKFEKSFAPTNRLRTEGTDNLLAAAAEHGVAHFVGQSFAGWPHARTGGPVKTESDPLDPDPVGPTREALAALLHLETAVTGAGGAVLRYGGFYGPGTGLEPGGEHTELVRKRQFPLVGRGRGVWSFVHTEDAAAATVAALERRATGIFNVVDDDPAPASEWLPYLAELLGAKRPRRLPRWVARLIGPHLVVMMDEARGASNAKARHELGWTPRYASWRDGFRAVLSPTTSTSQQASNPSSNPILSPTS